MPGAEIVDAATRCCSTWSTCTLGRRQVPLCECVIMMRCAGLTLTVATQSSARVRSASTATGSTTSDPDPSSHSLTHSHTHSLTHSLLSPCFSPNSPTPISLKHTPSQSPTLSHAELPGHASQLSVHGSRIHELTHGSECEVGLSIASRANPTLQLRVEALSELAECVVCRLWRGASAVFLSCVGAGSGAQLNAAPETTPNKEEVGPVCLRRCCAMCGAESARLVRPGGYHGPRDAAQGRLCACACKVRFAGLRQRGAQPDVLRGVPRGRQRGVLPGTLAADARGVRGAELSVCWVQTKEGYKCGRCQKGNKKAIQVDAHPASAPALCSAWD
eukprot:3590860-Rhodomonas_salina.3